MLSNVSHVIVTGMDIPKLTCRDMSPQQWARGVIINEIAAASRANATKLSRKVGKFKGNALVVMKHAKASTNNEGVYETDFTSSDKENDSQNEPQDYHLL